ncbi:hypothetical protein T02_6164 [Trichinella nativa]|uniref:Uncharacterized protein n=1 Tax=Trichinella nativa TaxID=6335 RepID=A0A0V1LU19_9BILA|nr:hypothetical protein T02_6164 [Trichinella nativa]
MNHQQRLCKVLMINSLLMHCKYCSMVSLLFKLYKLLIKVLENAKQNFTTHPITRRTFSQLETLAHRLDEFLNEYFAKSRSNFILIKMSTELSVIFVLFNYSTMSNVSSILRRECNARLICQIYDAPFVT